MAKIFHPVLALIASGTDRELAKYVEFLIEENKILRAWIPGQVHTKPDERRRLVPLSIKSCVLSTYMLTDQNAFAGGS